MNTDDGYLLVVKKALVRNFKSYEVFLFILQTEVNFRYPNLNMLNIQGLV